MEETKEKKVTVKPDKGQKETTTEKKVSKIVSAAMKYQGSIEIYDSKFML